MPDIKPLRIVVADDDELSLFILQEIIKDTGNLCTGFHDGDLLWEYATTHPGDVDMVILDSMMNRMGGTEVISRMKGHPTLKCIPIILQSGHACQNIIQEGLNLGADRYITKPFTSPQLLGALQELIVEYNLYGK